MMPRLAFYQSRLLAPTRFLLSLVCAALVFTSCQGGDDPRFLGSARIDSDPVTLAPALAGPLITVTKQEGDSVFAGEVVALVDTLPLHWQREELLATHAELRSTVKSRGKEASAIQAEASGVERDLKRIGSLVQSGSAPEQQEDRLRTSLLSARERQQAVQAGVEGLKGREAALMAKLHQLDDQLQRCRVVSPITGKVLTRYRQAGEMASPGQPVYELTRSDTLRAQFFVPQPALADLKVGGTVYLRLDMPEKPGRYLPAIIRSISDEAEFAPKNTQTRESRNELVFEVSTLAANSEGLLKRGLPVEVWKEKVDEP